MQEELRNCGVLMRCAWNYDDGGEWGRSPDTCCASDALFMGFARPCGRQVLFCGRFARMVRPFFGCNIRNLSEIMQEHKTCSNIFSPPALIIRFSSISFKSLRAVLSVIHGLSCTYSLRIILIGYFIFLSYLKIRIYSWNMWKSWK